MEGILILNFIFIIAIFFILLGLKSFVKHELANLKQQIKELKMQLFDKQNIADVEPSVGKKITSQAITEKVEKVPYKNLEKEADNIVKQKVIIKPEWKKRRAEHNKNKVFKPKKKTDFERFIGENLMNKIGILILIIAIGLGIKYAIDENWINPVARILLSLLTGTLLIGLAHKLRKNYLAFSSVLIGGGISVLYFSIAFGYQMYEIFNQAIAFILMLGITGFAVVLSLAYNRKELAVFAIIGGFLTPIMVSSGMGNYKVLFTYIMILDIGMLVLAYYKKWNIVNIVAYVATVILYSLWLIDVSISSKETPYLGALLFATAFYLIFFLMNIINNIKENAKFKAGEFIMLISNSFFYYSAGLFLLKDFASDYQGVFTILLAVINAGFAYPLHRRKEIDRNLTLLLIGLVITFVSLTAPVQLKGNFITLFWALELVLLIWLSQKSDIRLLKTASFVVTVLMLISLIIDWEKYYFNYNENVLNIISNKVFITGIVSIGALFAVIKLLLNETNDYFFGQISVKNYLSFLTILFILLGYFVPLFEIRYQVNAYYNTKLLVGISFTFYTYLYVLLVLLWTRSDRGNFLRNFFTWFSIFFLLLYALDMHGNFQKVLEQYLAGDIETTFAFIHFLGVIFIIALAFFSWQNIYRFAGQYKSRKNIFLWINVFLSVLILSYELDYLVLYLVKPDLENMHALSLSVHKIAWPILWAVIAFVLMIAGMRSKMKVPRIIAISLLFLTLLKLFAVDVWSMSEGGRIVAFISLGIILLIVSFLYQKLKKLIFEEEINDDLINSEKNTN